MRGPHSKCSMLGEAHLLNKGMYPLLTQSLSSIFVKPVIVFGLITDAQSATLSLGWDNRASVLCLDRVGTSEVTLPNCHACVSVAKRCHVKCAEKRKGKHSCSVDSKTAFWPHLQENYFSQEARSCQGEILTHTYIDADSHTQPYQPTNTLYSPEQIKSGCVSLTRRTGYCKRSAKSHCLHKTRFIQKRKQK